MNYTWADALIDAMEAIGITHIFGYPGAATIPFYDVLPNHKLEHILVRNEQAAIFAAQGWARSTKEVGVCITTSGPGASNTLTGLMDAHMDSIPLILITGQVPTNMIGTDMFQELDSLGTTMSITKHNFLVEDINDVVSVFQEAVEIATTGRPGPVHIDIPKDIFMGSFKGEVWEWVWEWVWKNVVEISELDDIMELIGKARQPVLLIGQGIKHSDAEKELNALVQKLGIPTVSTLLAKGVIKETDENYHGMLGMHGFYHCNMAMYYSDLIINIGSRFDDRIVGTYDTFAKNAKVVHVDIDRAELNKAVHTDIEANYDAKDFISAMLLHPDLDRLDIDGRRDKIAAWKNDKPMNFNETFSPSSIINLVNWFTEENIDDYIFVTDVGQHQMWSAQRLNVGHTTAWLSSGWAGTMWFSLPAAMGAAFAHPDKTIVVIVGDGWIQMNIQEFQTIAEHNLNIKVLLWNNGFLGMVRQWQDLYYDKNYCGTPIGSPKFKELAEAYRITWYTLDNTSELESILTEEFDKKGPALIECIIPAEENVFPMIPPGKALNETRVA